MIDHLEIEIDPSVDNADKKKRQNKLEDCSEDGVPETKQKIYLRPPNPPPPQTFDML